MSVPGIWSLAANAAVSNTHLHLTSDKCDWGLPGDHGHNTDAASRENPLGQVPQLGC